MLLEFDWRRRHSSNHYVFYSSLKVRKPEVFHLRGKSRCITVEFLKFFIECCLITLWHRFSAHLSCTTKFLHGLSMNFAMKRIQLIRMNIRSITTTMLTTEISFSEDTHTPNNELLPVPLLEYKILLPMLWPRDYWLRLLPRKSPKDVDKRVDERHTSSMALGEGSSPEANTAQ